MVNFPPERFENLTPDEIKSLPTLDEAFEDILREEYYTSKNDQNFITFCDE